MVSHAPEGMSTERKRVVASNAVQRAKEESLRHPNFDPSDTQHGFSREARFVCRRAGFQALLGFLLDKDLFLYDGGCNTSVL